MSYTHSLEALHTCGVSKSISHLLDPQFSGVPGAVLPHTRLTLNATAPSYMGHVGHLTLDRFLEGKMPMHSQHPRHDKNLMLNTVSMAPFFSGAVAFGHSSGRQSNMFEAHNGQLTADWLKYQGHFGHHIMTDTQAAHHPMTLEPPVDWLAKAGSKVTINLRVDCDTKGVSHSASKDGSENQGSGMESRDEISAITTPRTQQTSKHLLQTSPSIKHSIREILKPRENSHHPNNNFMKTQRQQEEQNDSLKREPLNKNQKRFSKGGDLCKQVKQPCLGDGVTHGHASTAHCKTLHGHASTAHCKTLHGHASTAHCKTLHGQASTAHCKTLQKEKTIDFTDKFTSGGKILSADSSHAGENGRHRMTFNFLKYQTNTRPEVMSVIDQQDQCSLATPRGLSERKSFQCPQCRYLTDRKNNLKRHIVTMHQDSGKVLECCGIPFQSKAALRDHNTIFHRGGYRCRICARNFCRKALLRRHLSVHSGQKDFFCELCGYATSHKSNLERHQKVHNKRIQDGKSVTCKEHLQNTMGPIQGQTDTIDYHACDIKISKAVNQDGVEMFNNNNNSSNNNKNNNNSTNTTSSNSNNKGNEDETQTLMFYTPESENPLSSEKNSTFSRSKNKRVNIFTSRLEATHADPGLSPLSNNSLINVQENEALGAKLPHFSDVTPYLHDTLTCENAKSNLHAIQGEDVQIQKDQDVNTFVLETQPSPVTRDIRDEINQSNEKTIGTSDKMDVYSSFSHSKQRSDEDKKIPSQTTRENLEKIQLLFFNKSETATKIDDVTRPKRCKRKNRMCSLTYSCEGCGQRMSSQFELQSHSCLESSRDKVLDLSLVIALQKGTLKAITTSSPLVSQ